MKTPLIAIPYLSPAGQSLIRDADGNKVAHALKDEVAQAFVQAVNQQAAIEAALKAADALVAMDRDYKTMPYPDFHAKHGNVNATALFVRARQAYVEARAQIPEAAKAEMGKRS